MMNYRKVVGALGIMLMLIGAAMYLPLLWSLYYGDADWSAFLITGTLTVLVGAVLYRLNDLKGGIHYKEAYAIVTVSWLLASAFGAVPFLMAGTFTSFADAFFETMSGFTTTGASVLTDIEALPHGVLFWRSLTHWLGGMGIIVMFVAVLSSLGVGGLQMFKAESPGPVAEKIKPRISESAKTLWLVYLAFTVVETLLLCLCGMNLFDALCHTFGTLATGGFSTKNASIGHYASPAIQWVIILFMFLAGVNFALHYQAFSGRSLKNFWRNSEFRLYTFLILAAIILVFLSISITVEQPFAETLRQASFQVTSIMTTTGYATADFDSWAPFVKVLLVALMFVGGCAGSTGGAIKVGRILILLKQSKLEIIRAMHPRAVLNSTIDGKPVSKNVVVNVLSFFFIYVVITCLSTVIMTLAKIDIVSAFTSVAATLGNIGPGLELVGPTKNYAFLPAWGKYYLSFLMLLGRLELYTVLVLLIPSTWKK